MNSTIIKERNLGIDFLKVWMSFEVVLCHYGHGSDEFVFRYFFSFFRSMAVPVFMIVSFYLSARFLLSEKSQFYKLAKRIQRIYLPLVAWALIYWVIYNCIALYGDVNGLHLPLKELLWQVVTGHCYNTAMWFNAVLALLTVLLYLICKRWPKYSMVIVLIVSLLAVFVSYSGLNNVFMSLRSELNFPLGRIAEMIPFAGFGLLLYKSREDKKYLHLIIFVASVFLVKELCGVVYNGEVIGYHYNGMKLFLCATLLVSLCVYMPLQKSPTCLKKTLAFLSRYSMGVYCIHMLVGTVIGFLNVDTDPLYYSLLIYLVSLISCCLISKVPYKLFNDIVA